MTNAHFLLSGLMMFASVASYAATGTLSATTKTGRTVTLTAITDDIIRVTNTASGETVPQ